MDSFVFAAIEGINFGRDFYVIRELSLLFPNGNLQHFHFKNPPDLNLNDAELKTALYTQRKLNGFGLWDNTPCCLPNSVCTDLLNEVAVRK